MIDTLLTSDPRVPRDYLEPHRTAAQELVCLEQPRRRRHFHRRCRRRWHRCWQMGPPGVLGVLPMKECLWGLEGCQHQGEV